MYWQKAVSNSTNVDAAAASLLDALERVHPIRDINAGPQALGRWLHESSQDGDIGDDTVVWLHGLLLPKAA
jgi:hypothetical protein